MGVRWMSEQQPHASYRTYESEVGGAEPTRFHIDPLPEDRPNRTNVHKTRIALAIIVVLVIVTSIISSTTSPN